MTDPRINRANAAPNLFVGNGGMVRRDWLVCVYDTPREVDPTIGGEPMGATFRFVREDDAIRFALGKAQDGWTVEMFDACNVTS